MRAWSSDSCSVQLGGIPLDGAGEAKLVKGRRSQLIDKAPYIGEQCFLVVFKRGEQILAAVGSEASMARAEPALSVCAAMAGPSPSCKSRRSQRFVLFCAVTRCSRDRCNSAVSSSAWQTGSRLPREIVEQPLVSVREGFTRSAGSENRFADSLLLKRSAATEWDRSPCHRPPPLIATLLARQSKWRHKAISARRGPSRRWWLASLPARRCPPGAG